MCRPLLFSCATGHAHRPYKLGMNNILVIGAGPTGSNTAALLASKGHHVTLVSRRGTPASHPGVRHVAADVNDPQTMRELATGVDTLINCAMPAYDRWPEEFPPIGSAALSVAAAVGARLVTLSNVYGYGPVEGPLRENHALAPHTVKGRVRAGMWDLARRSGVPVAEVRASDFLGHASVGYFNLFVLPALLKGEESVFPGDLDAAHSWSFTLDVAATLAAAATSQQSWGRAWHVPSSTACVRELANATARLAKLGAPRLRRMTAEELRQAAEADTMMAEVAEMVYLFERPFLLDASETQRLLGVSATPLEQVLADNLGPC